MRLLITCFTFVLVCVFVAETLPAADWGDLTGTFVFDGKPGEAKALAITQDQAFCNKNKAKLVNESLVVGKEGGIRNIIVYMYLRSDDAKPSIHPSYEMKIKDKVKLDNVGCRFEPHVVLVRTGQTLVLGNPDAVGHNTKIDTFTNPAINPLLPAGASLDQKYGAPERLPTQVSCNIHPWMTAWVVIKDNPYFAVTDAKGKFTIKNVPAGKWTFQFWQEKAGYVQDVSVGGKKTKWTRGRLAVDIPAQGTKDLGTIKVGPDVFTK